jgi:hypothetical protein
LFLYNPVAGTAAEAGVLLLVRKLELILFLQLLSSSLKSSSKGFCCEGYSTESIRRGGDDGALIADSLLSSRVLDL